jgi:hypothetical protein
VDGILEVGVERTEEKVVRKVLGQGEARPVLEFLPARRLLWHRLGAKGGGCGAEQHRQEQYLLHSSGFDGKKGDRAAAAGVRL